MVTGGAGYVGCVLVPKLLSAGYSVLVYDLMLFGSDALPSHPRLTSIQGDLRDTNMFSKSVEGSDAVIHLGAISNDPSFELDSELSRSINYDCFGPIVRESKNAGVKRFIYASTSSVYGVSNAPEVTEDHPLVPLTDYNKYKGMCEPILLDYKSPEFTTVIVRPATVCGYSPRMRFDLSVNILTNHAVNRRKITVFGGSQQRPNIHIDDIADLYVKMLGYPEDLVNGEIFNASLENHSMTELAEIVRNVVEEEYPGDPIEIEFTQTNDLRSYHVSTRKIFDNLGYEPKLTIGDAVRGICGAFKSGLLPGSLDDDIYVNVKTVKTSPLK